MSVWAIVAAAGRGDRLGLDRPKAFAALRGRPLLAESLERLDASDWIDAIVVAAPEGWEEPSVLLAEEVVGRVLEALGEGWDGAVPGLPVADTVKRVRGDAVVETVPRDDLVAVQTPQAFLVGILRAAFETGTS